MQLLPQGGSGTVRASSDALHLTALDFRVIFAFLSRRCVVTHQGEKNKKRRKDLPSGVYALVN